MCSHRHSVTLCVLHCSSCGAVLILRSLAQHSRRIARVRSLSLWYGAHLRPLSLWRGADSVKEILRRDLAKDLPQRSCQEISFREAWHLRRWVGSGDGLGRRWCPVAPRLFCVAGVALGDICLRFVWQAWHLVTSAFVLCGRRGTYGTGLALVTALVGAGVLGRRASFAWQAWHLRHGLAPVTALVGAGVLWRRASFAWQAWRLATSAFVLCVALTARVGSGDGLGRRWCPVAPRLFCVAGVALGDIWLRFVWQAWHLVTSAFVLHWVGSGDGLGRRWCPVAPRLFCVACVALGDICLRFVRQAWHLVTSAFVLCGTRGTYGTGLALVAALVGAGVLWRRASFAWQAWHLATSAFVLCGRRGTYSAGLAELTYGVIRSFNLKRACAEILPRDLSCRDLAQRHCVANRDLA
eukprot:s3759_g3.t1